MKARRRRRADLARNRAEVDAQMSTVVAARLVHAEVDAFLVATRLTVRARLLRDGTVLVLGTRVRHRSAALQAAQVEFLDANTKHEI